MIKINTPPPPKPMSLPTDPQAAWANGFRECATAMEAALEASLPRMDATAKAALLNRLDKNLKRTEGRPTTRAARAARKKMPCGHAKKYIERVENGRLLCTECGYTIGAMRA